MKDSVVDTQLEKHLHKKRRFRLLILLGVLSALLAAVLVIGIFYIAVAHQGNRVPPLPPLSVANVGAAPRFLFSINGVARPLGVAVSPAGDRIYVTESDGPRETKIFDRDGRLLGALNPPDSNPASRTPVYVAVSPKGEIYVSDRLIGAVHMYSPEGKYLGRLKPPGEVVGSWEPLALSFDDHANLFVTDTSPGGHRVTAFGPDGVELWQFGQNEGSAERLSYPNGAIADHSGRIVVADSNNGRVVVLDANGKQLWSFGREGEWADLGMPRGLAIDDNNRLYVVDTINHDVLIFDLGKQKARLLYTIGIQGTGDGEFDFPNGVATDHTGRLYVTDRENNRVQVWTY
ncbi:MAG: PQQ-binding-like beta-propeller repeat protein [Candidatus Marsarchaeota archaeon]|nr:PQQ-binding-like beta-propeller repeat protein [Candidatus Marsarchaeota archaeon]